MSYKKWAKVSENSTQLLNVQNIYEALSDEAKAEIKHAVDSKGDPLLYSANTTKNDKVRILELRAWPAAIMMWTQALGVQNRIVLDAMNSHESVERDEQLDPWNQLVSIFNERGQDFQPQNRAVKYLNGIPHLPFVFSPFSLLPLSFLDRDPCLLSGRA